jgi:hypothetical protein
MWAQYLSRGARARRRRVWNRPEDRGKSLRFFFYNVRHEYEFPTVKSKGSRCHPFRIYVSSHLSRCQRSYTTESTVCSTPVEYTSRIAEPAMSYSTVQLKSSVAEEIRTEWPERRAA